MSKSSIRLRKVGISTLAVAMSLGVAGVTAGTAYAATAPGLHADSAPDVTQGAQDQAAGDLTYTFTNAWTTGATVTLSLPAATCDTQANINKAIEFSAEPTVTITHDTSTDTGRIPTFSEALSSSNTQCGTAGIQDVLTITLNQPSSGGTAADEFDINVSGITYNVGSDAAPGAVDVTPASSGITTAPPTTAASNANVVNRSFMFVPMESAQPGTTGNTLGKATYSESTPGAYFAAGDNTVTLTLTGATFTDGVKPTITVPSGYTVSTAAGGNDGAPATTAGATYTFHVTAPSTLPSTGATMTISGLEADAAAGAARTATLDSAVVQGANAGSPVTDSADVLNVVNQSRIGGDDRYATAANLFNSEFGGANDVVLSGGEQFPDALSANYLAQELNTGTLLTRSDKLSPEARQAIISNYVYTVYITGQTAAVSQAVEDQLAKTHVGADPSFPLIQVVRLGGQDRYDTNAKINRYQLSGSHTTVVMAAGTAPYDSLAVGPIVYTKGYPLVLTNGAGLNHGELAQLQDLGAKNIVITGGTGVVSQAEQDELVKDGYSVVRIAGPTRYDTAADIARWGTVGVDANGDGNTGNDGVANNSQGLDSTTTNITNGLGFADALSAGPVAGYLSQPILLAKNTTEVGPGLSDYLGDKSVGTVANGSNIDTLNALGLNAATANSMMRDAAADIG